MKTNIRCHFCPSPKAVTLLTAGAAGALLTVSAQAQFYAARFNGILGTGIVEGRRRRARR